MGQSTVPVDSEHGELSLQLPLGLDGGPVNLIQRLGFSRKALVMVARKSAYIQTGYFFFELFTKEVSENGIPLPPISNSLQSWQ